MIQPAGFFIIQLGDNFCGNSSRGAKILLCPVHQGLSVSASAAVPVNRHQFDFPRIPLYRGAKNGIAPLPARNDPDPAGGRIKTIPEPAFVQCGLKRPETAVQPETGAMTGGDGQFHHFSGRGKNFRDLRPELLRQPAGQRLRKNGFAVITFCPRSLKPSGKAGTGILRNKNITDLRRVLRQCSGKLFGRISGLHGQCSGRNPEKIGIPRQLPINHPRFSGRFKASATMNVGRRLVWEKVLPT